MRVRDGAKDEFRRLDGRVESRTADGDPRRDRWPVSERACIDQIEYRIADQAGVNAQPPTIGKSKKYRVGDLAQPGLHRGSVFDQERNILPDRLRDRIGGRPRCPQQRHVRLDKGRDLRERYAGMAVRTRHLRVDMGNPVRDTRPEFSQKIDDRTKAA
jgi:hypothetical protein